ncbi:histidyl-tRNA synthetase, partial [candidate division KD3-62 bacterium DG_56]
MLVKFTAPRGTQDILPEDSLRWRVVEAVFADVCRRFGYGELRTPMFEETPLFTHSTGETSDIVTRQMYTFTDQGGRSLTLRPEITPSAARAYVERRLYGQGGVHKFCYVSVPIFRYERPQKGRLRQHHQFGIEAIGAPGPDIDAEVIALGDIFLRELGIDDAQLHINSIGCPVCRPRYREALRDALRPVLGELCENCQARFETNPLRILDDRNERCIELTQGAPETMDYLCEDCRAHFDGLQRDLKAIGIEFTVNPRIVRGLDYYTRTALPTPGVGFGSGEERILMILDQRGWSPEAAQPAAYIAAAGDAARDAAFRLAVMLRRAGIAVSLDHLARSLSAQMREAARIGARHAVIIGDDELAADAVTLRDMESGEQQLVP